MDYLYLNSSHLISLDDLTNTLTSNTDDSATVTFVLTDSAAETVTSGSLTSTGSDGNYEGVFYTTDLVAGDKYTLTVTATDDDDNVLTLYRNLVAVANDGRTC